MSASGFTAGALDRAQQLGMQTLLLSGLADDRLTSLLIHALQSVVFLLPVVTKWAVFNDVPSVEGADIWTWFDKDGHAQATTPDLLWHRWQSGEPPSIIGVHEVKVNPSGWTLLVNGKPSVPQELIFTVHVYGLVLTVTGRASDHVLFDASTRGMKKRQVQVDFDTPPANTPLRSFESEDDFSKFIQSRPESVKVINRVRLPRLQWNGLFWPLSVRRELAALMEIKPPDSITSEDFAELEQRSPASVWELPFEIPRKPSEP